MEAGYNDVKREEARRLVSLIYIYIYYFILLTILIFFYYDKNITIV